MYCHARMLFRPKNSFPVVRQLHRVALVGTWGIHFASKESRELEGRDVNVNF